ncbi:MAG: TniQ family protein [Sulfurimonas sp.]
MKKLLSKRSKQLYREPLEFVAHIKPLPNELLSSWLTRTAFAHYMKTTTFLNLYIMNRRNALVRKDLDFYNDEHFFEILYKKSKWAKEDILALSIRSEEGFLYDCNDCLVVPHQIRKPTYKRSNYGMLYCPKCLAEDKIPYWRKKWRYSYYTACPKHKIFLTDRCWGCGERIRIVKMLLAESVVYCSKCGKDLRLTSSSKVPDKYQDGLDAIKWFDAALERGYFEIGKQKVWSVLFFHIHNRLQNLMDRKEDLVLEGFDMIDEYKQLCSKLENYDSKKASPTYKAFFLNAMVYYIFQDFPNNFIKFIKKNKLIHRDFTHGLKEVPFWYEKMLEKYIPKQNKMGREITKEEVLGAIKYLRSLNKKVTQEEVAKLVGCHFTINKGFKKIYQSLNFALHN